MISKPENWLDEDTAKRLKEAQKRWGRQEDLAVAAGIPLGTVQKIIQGKTDPTFSNIRAMVAAMNENLDWIAFGSPRVEGTVLDGMAQGLRRIQAMKRADRSEFVEVPALDAHASAGPGAINADNAPSTTIAFRPEWLSRRGAVQGRLSALKVRGDSMEPTLKNGDMIVIDHDRTNPADGIFVIGFGEDIQVKRLQRLSPTRLVIASDNPLAGATEIDLRDDTQHPRIIGRVIWLGRDL